MILILRFVVIDVTITLLVFTFRLSLSNLYQFGLLDDFLLSNFIVKSIVNSVISKTQNCILQVIMCIMWLEFWICSVMFLVKNSQVFSLKEVFEKIKENNFTENGNFW